MEYIVKRTDELTNKERLELLNLFNVVFEKNRSEEEFMNQYTQNPLGYSLHSIALDQGIMVATQTYIPSYYLVDGKRLLASSGADTAVLKQYRDFFTLYETIKELDDYSKNNGYAFNYGFPNDNSYPVFKKAKMWKDIGKLETYVLPLKIGSIKRRLSFLNFVSKALCYLYLLLNGHGGSKQISQSPISKESSSYNLTRYKRMDANYSTVSLAGVDFVYKVLNYDGIRAAFLIDVFQKSEYNFRKAVRFIYSKEKSKIDLILYVGVLPKSINNIGLFKVPRQYEPKHFNFVGKIYDNDTVDKQLFFNINNWDVNLSNYDLI